MADAEAPATSLNVNYLKSPSFREIHSDGVLGGATPQNRFWVAFYTERFPVPQVVRHTIVPSEDVEGAVRLGDPGEPIEGRSGIIRTMEVGVFMSLEDAKLLHEWLGKQLVGAEGESK
jgi:hypothetical protein